MTHSTDFLKTIDWLFNQLPMFSAIGPGAYKPGLNTAKALDEAFGHPHLNFKSIHIAGTNGKGSTSHAIASMLMAAGYKVGLYTSPHLVDFRERIRVNGKMIEEDAVVDFVQRYRSMDLDLQPSFFELTTIMAFDYFSACGVDFAVVEVGLGGLLDTTNIITPVMSIITNVSLDHTALLGNTLPEIARQKAGIFKPGILALVGETDDELRRVYNKCSKHEGENYSPLLFAQDVMPCDSPTDNPNEYDLSLLNGGNPLTAICDLDGPWQRANMNTALLAAFMLPLCCDAKIGASAAAYGLSHIQENTGLMGRWMHVHSDPTIICDTGHNIGAWMHLAPRLQDIAKNFDLRIVLGFASDKDAESIIAMLPKNARYIFTQPNVKRARPASELLSIAHEHELTASAYDTVTEAVEHALRDTPKDGFIFIGGSNFVLAEALPILHS